ncbi:hypothetical protein [Dapis sp. BLCC M229]
MTEVSQKLCQSTVEYKVQKSTTGKTTEFFESVSEYFLLPIRIN